MNKMSILLTAVLFPAFVYAQHFKIEGTVVDDKEKGVPFAYVSIAQNNVNKQTVQADEQGVFLMQVAAGKYDLVIQVLGYTDKKLPLTVVGDTKLGNIVLTPESNKLDEVVIAGKKVLIQTEQGKTIVNIRDNMKLGNNLLDLLKNMPGVTVGADGTISIQGKQGIMVLIDDKPTYLQGRDLAEYLKSINASEVAKVELISQPSAKYDAEGNAGIINIKTNDKKKEGWSGVASLNYQQGRYPFVQASSNITYRKDKVAYTFSPGYYRGEGFLEATNVSTAKQDGKPATIIKEDVYKQERFPDYSLKFGVDYDVNEKTALAITAVGRYHTNEELDKAGATITDVATGRALYNYSENRNGHVRYHPEVNLFARHDIDSNHSVQVSADCFFTRRELYQELDSRTSDDMGSPVGDPLILDNVIPDRTDLYVAKADYTGKIAGLKVECGAKTSIAKMNEENRFEQYTGGQWIKDTVRSNHFIYNENINAAYVSASGTKGKLQVQCGLRAEHTHAEGNQVTQDKQFTQDYLSLFPTAYATYKVDEQNTVECNYGRRIQRPYYRELNPFTKVTSPFNIKTGNPELRPQFTHKMELKHNFKGHFITTLTFTSTTGVFTDRLVYDARTRTNYYSTGNNGKRSYGALSAYFNNQLCDWLNLGLMGEAHYVAYEGTFNDRHYYSTGTGFYMSLDTQFSVKPGWAASLHARYAGPYRSGLIHTTGGSAWVNAEVSKSMFEDTVTIKLATQDPFGWYRYNSTMDIPEVTVASTMAFNTQTVSLAFAYNFGKRDDIRRRNSSEESRRM